MFCNPNTVAHKKYQRGVLVTMSFYAVLLLSVVYYFNHHHPHGSLAYILAILPAIPIVALLGVVGIYLRDEKDEFQRWMMIQAMLWSTGVVLAAASVLGFLQSFTDYKPPAAYFAFVLFWAVFGFVQGILQWNSRRSDD